MSTSFLLALALPSPLGWEGQAPPCLEGGGGEEPGQLEMRTTKNEPGQLEMRAIRNDLPVEFLVLVAFVALEVVLTY